MKMNKKHCTDIGGNLIVDYKLPGIVHSSLLSIQTFALKGHCSSELLQLQQTTLEAAQWPDASFTPRKLG